MELTRHKLTLQRLFTQRTDESEISCGRQERRGRGAAQRSAHHPVDADKVLGFLGPNRELHVAHGEAVLTHPELVLVTVDEHLWQVVELWDQLLTGETLRMTSSLCSHLPSKRVEASRVVAPADLSYLDISRVPLAVPPRAANAGERSLRMVELVLVGVEEECGERLLQTQGGRDPVQKTPCDLLCMKKVIEFKGLMVETDYSEHPHECGVRRGVKSSVVVRRGAVVVPRFVALGVERGSLGIQSANWLGEKKKRKLLVKAKPASL